jgi:hypothetical protein
MFSKKGPQWAAPRASSAQGSSAAAASSAAAPMEYEQQPRFLSTLQAGTAIPGSVSEGKTAKIRPKRTLAPSSKDWPELDWLEEKSQAAFESQLDSLWLENNADFHYCDMHQQVCEMMQNHPVDTYNPACQKCLKSGGLMDMFFHKEGNDLNIEQAQAAWMNYNNQKAEVHKSLMQNPSGNLHLAKQFDFRERSAFLRYAFLAWQRNNDRVVAIRENGKNADQSSRFNLLPSHADPVLCQFVKDATARNMHTGSGMAGKSCNVKLCGIHERGGLKNRGHAIQVFNKWRYEACGICTMSREQSDTQRQADCYDNSAPLDERAGFSFAASASKRAWRAPAAASSSDS